MFISAQTLIENHQKPGVKVLHVEMINPVSGAVSSTPDGYIPGALNIDLDKEGSDHHYDAPHRRLSPRDLSELLGTLGILPSDTIYLYDDFGLFCAPRLWFMLKALNHERVFVLDGGFPAYVQANGQIAPQTNNHRVSQTQYTYTTQTRLFVDAEDVEERLANHYQVIDARSTARFKGKVREPRPGVRSGHMPGSLNLPYTALLKEGKLQSDTELLRAFKHAGVDLQLPITTSCGSGITACIVGMAALKLGASMVTIYDGSWAEWGADTRYAVEVDDD